MWFFERGWDLDLFINSIHSFFELGASLIKANIWISIIIFIIITAFLQNIDSILSWLEKLFKEFQKLGWKWYAIVIFILMIINAAFSSWNVTENETSRKVEVKTKVSNSPIKEIENKPVTVVSTEKPMDELTIVSWSWNTTQSSECSLNWKSYTKPDNSICSSKLNQAWECIKLYKEINGNCYLMITDISWNCAIKWNISVDSQKRYYHLPWTDYYINTKIDTKYGERYFCTEYEALKAWWNKASSSEAYDKLQSNLDLLGKKNNQNWNSLDDHQILEDDTYDNYENPDDTYEYEDSSDDNYGIRWY